MNFHNRSFERGIRKLARLKLKSSKALWKEYKRLKPRRLQNATGGWIGALWIAAIAARFLDDRPPEYALFAVTMYGLSAVLYRSVATWTLMYRSMATYIFTHLPISDPNIFRWHIKYVLRSSLTMLILFTAGYGMALRDRIATVDGVFSILLLAILQWLTCCGATLLLVPFLPERVAPLQFIAYGCGAIALFCPALPQPVVEYVHQALVITPAGSLSYFVRNAFLFHRFSIAPLLPSIAYIIAMPIAYLRLRRSYNTDLFSDRMFGAMEKPEQLDESALVNEEPVVQEMPRAEAERSIYRDGLRAPEFPSTGSRLDAFIFSRLRARDRVICNFLTGGANGGWGRNWTRGTVAALITLALAAVPGGVTPWMVWLPGAIGIMLAMPIMGGRWIGFVEVASAGKLSPVYACHPVGYDQVTRLLLKVNLLRIALWSPFFVATIVAVLHVFDVAPALALTCALLGLYTVTVFQPFCIVGKFSQGSNDTRVTRLRPIIAITVLVLGFLGFGTLTVVAFVAQESTALIAAAAMPFCSFAAWGTYRWAYNSVSFDLVHEPKAH